RKWRGEAVFWAGRGGAVFCSHVLGSRRWTLFSQPRCTFRKAPKKAELRKGDGAEGDLAGPQLEAVTHEANPASFGRLLRPLVFTVGFTGGSFGAAAIWQYESLKARVQTYFDELRADWLEKLRPQKQGDVRKQVACLVCYLIVAGKLFVYVSVHLLTCATLVYRAM
uniref:Uncharacterized protein n=1 Tax=Scleropages formosus TaxID=113540 RepID=A0A8C9WR06_SCLFO